MISSSVINIYRLKCVSIAYTVTYQDRALAAEAVILI